MKTTTTLSVRKSVTLNFIVLFYLLLFSVSNVHGQNNCSANFSFYLDAADPNTIHLTNLSTGPNVTYWWSFGDGQTSSSASPGTHTFATGGKYLVMLHVTGAVPECNSGLGQEIIVPGICSPYFSFTHLYGYTYQFNATQTTGLTYFWDFEDGTTVSSASATITHTFPDNDYYHVCLKSTSTLDPTCQNTYCQFLNVNLDQNCYAYFSILPDSSTTDTTDFIIYDQSTGNNLSYLWEFGDGTSSTLKNPTHDYTGDGPYSIFLTVTNDSCKSMFGDTIFFPTLPHLLAGKWHVKVVNKNVINGIKENVENKATLQNYPNPFKGNTTINYSINAPSRVEVSVYNLLGSKIEVIQESNKIPGNYSVEWNATNLHEGIYLLQLKTNDQVITKKIVLNK